MRKSPRRNSGDQPALTLNSLPTELRRFARRDNGTLVFVLRFDERGLAAGLQLTCDLGCLHECLDVPAHYVGFHAFAESVNDLRLAASPRGLYVRRLHLDLAGLPMNAPFGIDAAAFDRFAVALALATDAQCTEVVLNRHYRSALVTSAELPQPARRRLRPAVTNLLAAMPRLTFVEWWSRGLERPSSAHQRLSLRRRQREAHRAGSATG